MLAQEAVRQLEQGAELERCQGDARSECVAQAERWLQKLDTIAPRDIDALLLRTRVLKAIGESDKALALLSERCPNLAGRARSLCFKTRLDLSARGDSAVFGSAVRDYLADTCTDSDVCAAALEKTGDMSAARNDHHAALSLYDRAVRERSDDRLWMKVARSCVRVGAYPRALRALDRVHKRAELEPEYSRLVKSAQRGDIIAK
jgi:Flp pilus assembly protein TadD